MKLVGAMPNPLCARTPVPVRAIVAGEFGALLAIVTVPFNVPAVVGANTALKVVLAPAATVFGVVKPVTLYPAPLTVSCEMVSVPLPVFVRVNVWDFVCPSTMLP